MSDVIQNNERLLEFLELVGRLKHLPRTGWVIKDVLECESVAGHMYRMAIMTLLLPEDDEIDKQKCMQIAVVHDLAECIVGDLTPLCGVPPEEKHRREDEAMKVLCELSQPAGPSLYELYKEYEEQATIEAKFVKELDRFDMIQQAFEYEKRERNPGFLQEFFTSTEGKFSHPMIVGLLTELNRQRNNFIDSKMINGVKGHDEGEEGEIQLEPQDVQLEPEEAQLEPEEAQLEPEEVQLEPEEVQLEPEEVQLEPLEAQPAPQEVVAEPEEAQPEPQQEVQPIEEMLVEDDDEDKENTNQ